MTRDLLDRLIDGLAVVFLVVAACLYIASADSGPSQSVDDGWRR